MQGALSVILLVGAGLFVRSLERVRAMRLGYDAQPVLMVMPNYRGLRMDSASKVVFRRRLLMAAQAIPGVQFAARINSRPFGSNVTDLRVSGIDSVQRLGRFNFQIGTSDYFKVMGTRITRGRPFTEADRAGAPPVAVVSEAMARVLWPGEEAIGRCIRVSFAGSADTKPCTTVVGIAENAVHHALIDDQRFMYYLPLEQVMPDGGNQIFLRVSGREASALSEAVRRELQKMMPGQGYVTVAPLEGLVDAQRRSWRLGATMFVAFGVLALVVAAVGLHGVIAYNVAQRAHELGVRVALGARSRDLARLVVGQGVAFAVTGAILGLALAVVSAPWIQPLLFEQPARDPETYGSVSAILVMMAVLASALPAYRAARTDPNVTLRND